MFSALVAARIRNCPQALRGLTNGERLELGHHTVRLRQTPLVHHRDAVSDPATNDTGLPRGSAPSRADCSSAS